MRPQTTMRKILIIALAGIFGAFASDAFAQSFYPVNATKLVFASNTTSTANTVTLLTTPLGTSYSLRYPSLLGTVGQVLVTTDGIGTLGWADLTGSNSGDVTLAGPGNYLSLTGTQVINQALINLASATHVTGILPSANGGTGVNNGTNTITLANNLTTVGNFPLTLTTTASTNVTFPTSGTLIASGSAAGSDLSGTYPNPTVARILGNTVPANLAGALINDGAGVLSWTSVPTGTGTVTGTNTGDQTITLTGPVTGSGTGTFATTITNSAVTYAKIQNVSANSLLLGSSATGSGAPPSEITLGSGLSMTGSTLSATGSLSGSGTANTISKWTGASALGNSSITDNGTTVATAGNLTLSGANKVLTLTGDGTGVSSFTTGVQGATTYNYTLPVTTPTANQVLTATAISGASPFAVTLGWSNGGGGLSGLTANGAMYATGATTATSTGAMTDGQLLVGKTGLAPVAATLTAGSNISITNGAGTITIASTASGTLSGMTANGAVYATGATTATSTGALTNGQLLIGSTGVAPVAASLTAGSNITITPGAGSITIASSNPVVFARKTANVTLTASNVNLQADPDLLVTLVANATYEFSGVITYNGSTSASDLKLGIAFNGTTTSIRWSAVQGGTAIAPSSVTAVTTSGGTGTLGTNILAPFVADDTSTNELSVFVSGIIVVGASGGTFQILESQNTSQAATTSVRLGSHIKATRVQ